MSETKPSWSKRLSNRFRTNRDVLQHEVIRKADPGSGGIKIHEVGGRLDCSRRVGFAFLADHRITLTLQNVSKSRFATIADALEGLLSYATGTGPKLEVSYKSFDLCHSNSVIEHVGPWRVMYAFAEETRGAERAFGLQTPSFWFPIGQHFAAVPFNHWLPRPMRAGLTRTLPLSSVGRAKNRPDASCLADNACLLLRGQIATLVPDTTIHAERMAMIAKSSAAVYLPQAQTKIR